MSPRPLDSEPNATNHRHEALFKTDLTLDCFPSNACMLLELHHPHLHLQGHQRVAAQAWATLCISCLTLVSSPSLNVELLPSFWEVSIPVNMGYQFCLLFPTWGWGSLGVTLWPICTPSVDENGLLIHSKSHNHNAQRELDKTVALAVVYRARFCLVLFRHLPPSPCPCFLNEMLLRLFVKRVIPG